MNVLALAPRVVRAALSAGDIAREIRWKRREGHSSPFPPSWPPPADVPETVTVRWPGRYYCPTMAPRMDALVQGLRRYVRVDLVDLGQPCDLIRFQVVSPAGVGDFAIDCVDDCDRIIDATHTDLTLYFKMQFTESGYSDGRIVPGGYLSPTHLAYQYLQPLRALKRSAPPRSDVYGRFGIRFSTGDTNRSAEIRSKAVEMLRAQRDFHYAGSLGLVRYSRSLREAAQSRICIDLPGNGDLCYRLIDYLSVGACIIGPRPHVRLPFPLEDRKNIVFCREDLSDLVPLCKEYLEDEDARERIAAASVEYFDRYLHRDQLAAYYLHRCLSQMEKVER